MDCLLTNLYWNNAPISGAVGDSSTKVFSKPISNNSYASDAASDAKPKVFGHGRISNATIESFFKILKHSILRHQTNLRPGEFLLKIYATINARLKANQHDIPQTGSKRKRRRTKRFFCKSPKRLGIIYFLQARTTIQNLANSGCYIYMIQGLLWEIQSN